MLCFVLVWDLTAVRWPDAPPTPTDNSISRCEVLPFAMRYRQQILEQISLAELATADVLPRSCCEIENKLVEIRPAAIRNRLGGPDLLYRLMSLQR
jgi:hypothetical protein